jgi:hypothetical protein
MNIDRKLKLTIWQELIEFHEEAQGMALITWLGVLGWLSAAPSILNRGIYHGINDHMAHLGSYMDGGLASVIFGLVIFLPMVIGMFIYLPILFVVLAKKCVME